ncbi:MAG: hypothetical protein A2V83_07405 [Nitrospirae bacterium RBG_16_64_22]|nr:MAG: hypothetical protein A2V83_07405 [Nitrospirae bacterium RBG_16_64_22]
MSAKGDGSRVVLGDIAGHTPYSRGRETGLFALATAVLLLLFFLGPIWKGEILSPADVLQGSVPWGQVTSDFEPANAIATDDAYQFRPWRTYTVASLKEGRIPLWNPYNYAGAPFLANGQSAVLYPLNLPFLVLPERAAVLCWDFIRLLIAAVSSFAFARTIGLSRLGSAVSAWAFTFCGFLVVWLHWPHANVAIWLPALFLAAELVIRRPTGLWGSLLACVVCVQFLGGHPETSLHVLSAAAAYGVWRIVRLWRDEGSREMGIRRLATFAGSVILGTAGAAVQLVPLSEYVLNSAALADRLSDSGIPWIPSWKKLAGAVSLICPYCLGSSMEGDIPIGALLGIGNFNELSGGYVGLMPLLLAAAAIGLGNRRGPEAFFGTLGVVSLCVAFSVPPVAHAVSSLPLFNVAGNHRMLLLFAFSAAVLAGCGVDLLRAAVPEQSGRFLRKVRIASAAGAVAIGALAAGALLSVVLFREPILDLAKRTIIERSAKLNQDPESYVALLPRSYDRLTNLIVREGSGRAVLLLLSGLTIGYAFRSGSGAQRRSWILSGVLLLDLFSFGRNYNPSIPQALHYPSHESIDFVRKQPGLFRVLTLDGGFPPETNMVYGLSEVRGYNALETPEYLAFLSAAGEFPVPHRHFRTLHFSRYESRLVDFLNVEYVISGRPLDHPKLSLVRSGGAYVYRNGSAMPRAFVVHETEVLSEPGAVAARLRDPDFDPGKTALLVRGPRLIGQEGSDARVRIMDYAPEVVRIDVSLEREGVLVLSDAWYSGWTAAVDGLPAEVLRTNLAFRGVQLSAGAHVVEFRYDPPSFRAGLWISGGSAAFAAAWAGLALRRNRDRRGAVSVESDANRN